MIFKDRQEAANKLYKRLSKDPLLKKGGVFVVSLLRGGAVLGNILAKKLNSTHLPLVVTKIPAPYNPELAIGALCFDITYLEKRTISMMGLKSVEIREQIKIAEHKFVQYCSQFGLNEKDYKQIKGKITLLVDDGVATGSSVRTALLYLRSKNPAKIILAIPIASADTEIKGFDKVYILDRPWIFGAVSQFYKNFPQVEDKQVKRLIR